MTSDDRCNRQNYASGPFTRRDALGAVRGCGCAWNVASV